MFALISLKFLFKGFQELVGGRVDVCLFVESVFFWLCPLHTSMYVSVMKVDFTP